MNGVVRLSQGTRVFLTISRETGRDARPPTRHKRSYPNCQQRPCGQTRARASMVQTGKWSLERVRDLLHLGWGQQDARLRHPSLESQGPPFFQLQQPTARPGSFRGGLPQSSRVTSLNYRAHLPSQECHGDSAWQGPEKTLL